MSFIKNIKVGILVVLFVLLAVPQATLAVYVNGYYRSNGTYVQGHQRSAPDGNPYNNYSFPGNYNPNTGGITGGNSQTYLDNYYGSSGYSAPSPSYSSPVFPSAPATPSCPLMSSYDSLSGDCKCFSGYVVGTDFLGKESCVSAESKCTDSLGYGGRYNSLSNKCECRYGYVYNGGKCESETTYCSNALGLMSRYDSLSQKCECISGYEFDGSSCIYKTNNYGVGASAPISFNTCPANSHTSTSDVTRCTCDSGYMTNTSKDACVFAPVSPIVPVRTDDQLCQDSFGFNSIFSGIKNDNGTLNCECVPGYQFGSGDDKKCVLIPPLASVISSLDAPQMEEKRAQGAPQSKSPFQFDKAKESVYKDALIGVLVAGAALRECPSLDCKVLRYHPEAAEVSLLGHYADKTWYSVSLKDSSDKIIKGWMYNSVLKEKAPAPSKKENPIVINPPPKKTQKWYDKLSSWLR